MTHRWDPNRYYYTVRVNLRVVAIKEYSTFSNLQDKSLTIRCSLAPYPGDSLGWVSYSSAEVQSAYSTAPHQSTLHKDTRILLFLIDYPPIKMDIIRCYLLPKSSALKLSNKKCLHAKINAHLCDYIFV